MLREVAEVLDVEGRQREFVGQAAGGDPGVVLRPRADRRSADAAISPQTAAMSSLLCSTGIRPSHRAMRCCRTVPHCRRTAHFVSSPWVTKVMAGSVPISSASNPGESRRLKLREATSVSRTTRLTGYARSARRAA